MDKSRQAIRTSLILVLALGLHAGVVAQDEALLVTIAAVESSAFPLVAVSITVEDAHGFPVTGLTAGDFRVEEGEGETLVEALSAASDALQHIDLILALDVSVTEDLLLKMSEAVKAFLNTLGSEDKVTILSFADQVRQVARSASPLEASRAVDGLVAQGNYTALHDVVHEISALTSGSAPAQTAAVILTDSTDNAGRFTLDQTLAAIQETSGSSPAPIHIIGFGPKMAGPEAQQLHRLAGATGGHALLLSSAEDIRAPLQAIGTLSRHGYQITFESRVPADEGDHRFSIHVSSHSGKGTATDRFTAVPHPLDVELAGPSGGQVTGDVVYLAASVAGRAPVVAVEYRLNGQLLARVTDPPYVLTWPSANTEPGAYVLTALAIDSAGNTGEAKTDIVLPPPMSVKIISLPKQVTLGEEAVLEAQITALAEKSKAELLLDGWPAATGESTQSRDTYRFVLDSDPYRYRPGTHRVTVRAEDVQGRKVEDSRTIVFAAYPGSTPTAEPAPKPAPSPARRPGWLGNTLVTATLVVSATAAIALTALIVRIQRRRRQVALPLEIHNLGNVRSRFELRADEPEGGLRFGWLLDGEELVQRQVTASLGRSVQADPRPEAEPPPPARPLRERVQAGRAISGVSSFTGTIADLLSAVSSMLPSSVGAPLRRASSQLRRGRAKASRLTQTSSRASRALSGARRSRTRATGRPKTKGQNRQSQAPPVLYAWSQTPFVEPREVLTVDLRVDPVRPYRTQQYAFKVISKSIELEDTPLISEDRSLQTVRVPWFRRFLPYALLYLFVIAASFAVYWLVYTGVLG